MSMTTSALAPAAIASWRERLAMSESAESAARSVWREVSCAGESGCGAEGVACGEGVAREGGAECEQAASAAARATMVSGRIEQSVYGQWRSATALTAPLGFFHTIRTIHFKALEGTMSAAAPATEARSFPTS